MAECTFQPHKHLDTQPRTQNTDRNKSQSNEPVWTRLVRDDKAKINENRNAEFIKREMRYCTFKPTLPSHMELVRYIS